MKKIRLSLGCPNCNSSNIESILTFNDEKTEQNEYCDEPVTITTREKIYECKCNDCMHEYKVNHGYEKYTVFSNPCAINCLGDVHLLALYESESGFESNYKIVSINSSPYDESVNQQETSYFMFIDGEEFPVLLSKQSIGEMIESPKKAHVLVKNTCYSRNR